MMPSTIFDREFVQSALYSSIAYYVHRQKRHDRSPYRSTELEPSADIGKLFDRLPDWRERFAEEQKLVNEVIHKRLSIVRADTLSSEEVRDIKKEFSKGSVLVKVGHGMYERLMEMETDGFFDSEDMPPWNYWVALAIVDVTIRNQLEQETFLLSWIPDSLYSIAEKGLSLDTLDNFFFVTADHVPQRSRDIEQRAAREAYQFLREFSTAEFKKYT